MNFILTAGKVSRVLFGIFDMVELYRLPCWMLLLYAVVYILFIVRCRIFIRPLQLAISSCRSGVTGKGEEEKESAPSVTFIHSSLRHTTPLSLLYLQVLHYSAADIIHHCITRILNAAGFIIIRKYAGSRIRVVWQLCQRSGHIGLCPTSGILQFCRNLIQRAPNATTRHPPACHSHLCPTGH